MAGCEIIVALCLDEKYRDLCVTGCFCHEGSEIRRTFPAFRATREVDCGADIRSTLSREQRLNSTKRAAHDGDSLRVDKCERMQMSERGELVLKVGLHHLDQ